MLRDMEIRKFQKEHMDDLFGVIRKNLSGMMCLTRFAREQLMDGDVLFFNDVEGKMHKEIKLSQSSHHSMNHRCSVCESTTISRDVSSLST